MEKANPLNTSGSATPTTFKFFRLMKMQLKDTWLWSAKRAAVELMLLPKNYEDLTPAQLEFLRSDLVGQILDGAWPEAMTFSKEVKNGN